MSPKVQPGPDPTKVGAYLIEKKLGAGGMGTVYLGEHEETHDRHAVKVLAASLAREEGLVARFEREIDAMQKLKNPHVVELFDHGVDDGTYYYAMEYVDGETLTARLRREKRLEWREVIELSIQICSALKAAHDAGIIHRDLKPSNLLLTRDGTIKLTDFGVAQVFAGSKLTITGGIIGTAEYMSPEQAAGKRITRRSDLYSLGAVMYVMITGRPPFSGKTTLDVIQKHKFNQFDRPRLIVPDIPHWLDEIICQLMEKDPDKRFADAYIVARRLQEVGRKVELSTRDVTFGGGTGDGSGTTIAVTGASGPGDAGDHGTLMRDLMRAEIDAEQEHRGLRRVFDNTWVLFGLLVLLVAGVGYSLRSDRLSPEQLFAEGVRLLDENEEANWQSARDRYFAPLTALKSAEWDERIDSYLTRIRVQELKESFSGRSGRRRSKSRAAGSEVERLISLAQNQQDEGDTARAEQTLAALETLLADSPEHEAQLALVKEYLRELRLRRDEKPTDDTFLEGAMKRADALEAAGKHDEAVAIWRSVLALYEHDTRRTAEVERARKGLKLK